MRNNKNHNDQFKQCHRIQNTKKTPNREKQKHKTKDKQIRWSDTIKRKTKRQNRKAKRQNKTQQIGL